MLVKCSHKVNGTCYLQVLKNTEKNAFLGHYFQQDNAPVHKSKIIDNKWSRSKCNRNFMANFEAAMTRTEFLGKFRKIVKCGTKLTQMSLENCMKIIQTV